MVLSLHIDHIWTDVQYTNRKQSRKTTSQVHVRYPTGQSHPLTFTIPTNPLPSIFSEGTYQLAAENGHAISPSPSSSSASPSRSTISPSPSSPSTFSISLSVPCMTDPCWFFRPRLLGPGPGPSPGPTCVGMEAAVRIPGGMSVSTPAAFCALMTGQ